MLKGTATIELTDVKTGKKEVAKHDNLVTNAVSDILTLNPFGYRFSNYINTYKITSGTADQCDELGSSFFDGLLPVCPNLMGGILLYESALEESPEKYYADMNNPLVGYASNDVNEGVDPMRGSMNLTESGPLEDGNGYRFVFDFGTNQANGTIASLGLTSARGGKAGYGSAYDYVHYPLLCVGGRTVSTPRDGSNVYQSDNMTLHSLISVDADAETAIYARVTAANTITVGRAKVALNSVGLSASPAVVEKLEEVQITTTNFAGVIKSTLSYVTSAGANTNIPDRFGGCLIDGGDGYIWGFQHEGNANGNTAGSASVLWIKISKDDFSYTEGSWSLNAQLMPFGFCYVVDAWNAVAATNTIIKDGRLYAVAKNQKGVYSINLANPSDAMLMECDFVIATAYDVLSADNYYRTPHVQNVTDVSNVILYRNAYVRNNQIYGVASDVYTTSPLMSYESNTSGRLSKNKCLAYSSGSLSYVGPFKVCVAFAQYFYGSNYLDTRAFFQVYLMTPYLATINNLDTPVTKTADKTMKITYILREE